MSNSLSIATKQILNEFNIRLKKDLGQHFLTDQVALSRIVDSANIGKDDLVLEIGTGIGTLTKKLCKKAAFVISSEYDYKIIPAAEKYLKDEKNWKIIPGDFLKLDLDELFSKYTEYKIKRVAANLPYYITSPIISKLIENKSYFKNAVLTIQKEVAERIIAKPGTKEYSSFSIFVNYHCKAKIIANIARSSFITQPAVGSSILLLEIREKPAVEVKNEELFFKVMHAAFLQRRKMLRNAIENAHIKGIEKENIAAALEVSGIDSKRRGETLSIEEFAKLSDNLT